jgi:predicted AlkP superfamily phosphohydrolase/phosphomutase
MKILVLGVDGAAPELLFGFDDLPTVRRLMEIGAYGPLKTVVPPTAVPAWMCLATSQDPGCLGLYGLHHRNDRSYCSSEATTPLWTAESAIWDYFTRNGKRSIIAGVPPCFPPQKTLGISSGCFMNPETERNAPSHPFGISHEVFKPEGRYSVVGDRVRTRDTASSRDQILALSRAQFEVVRQLLSTKDWDYFQFVDMGLERMQHMFSNHRDLEQAVHAADPGVRDTIHEYYCHLDQELAQVLELLTDETILLVVSAHSAQLQDDRFRVNDWLVRAGFLVLNSHAGQISESAKPEIDWTRTMAWSEGDFDTSVWLNVKGREPLGIVAPADYETVRNKIKATLEAAKDADGKPLETSVFKPEEIYCRTRGVAPDLITYARRPYWRKAWGGIGSPTAHTLRNITVADDSKQSQFGAFILAASNSSVRGEIIGAHLLDMAPTVLDLAGYETPPSMQGRSLAARADPATTDNISCSPDEESLIRERLSGLGYIG